MTISIPTPMPTNSAESGATVPMNMASMMTFHNTISEALFSDAWTPSTGGQYAGACIFLVLLGLVFRLLTALVCSLEHQWSAGSQNRRISTAGRSKCPHSSMQVAELQLEKGMDEGGEVQQKPASSVSEARVTGQPEHILRTWRWNEDIPKAGLITFKAGIGYLLMIAVMTGNVGYFLSVLGGIFVGELAGGRYASYV